MEQDLGDLFARDPVAESRADVRLELVRAVQTGGTVAPLGEQDSSALRALAASNALIRRETHSPPARKGDLVEAYLQGIGGKA